MADTTPTLDVRDTLLKLLSSALDKGDHGTALDVIQKLQDKPGVKTTEFFLSLVASALGFYLAMTGHEQLAATVSGCAVATYNLSRGLVKKAQAGG